LKRNGKDNRELSKSNTATFSARAHVQRLINRAGVTWAKQLGALRRRYDVCRRFYFFQSNAG
jgi:hypothetical protein